MNIVEFEKEVMLLFKEHYKNTEKIKAVNWFSLKIDSFYKHKTIEIRVTDGLDPRDDYIINGEAITFDELFINSLYLLRDYLSQNPYKDKLCKTCKGEGEWEEHGGSGHSWTEKCPKCKGTGKIDKT